MGLFTKILRVLAGDELDVRSARRASRHEAREQAEIGHEEVLKARRQRAAKIQLEYELKQGTRR